jgi:hypothetical protein
MVEEGFSGEAVMDIFVSVGTGLSPQQEQFVSAVEERLRAAGLTPRTIGRNTFSADAPLRAVTDLMDRCGGAVVIALERYFFPGGVERRGSAKETPLSAVGFPTVWNQIEAAMAYSRKLPLLVLVDEQLRCDGLLEKGNDWHVQEVKVEPGSLNSAQFNGVLASWRDRITTFEPKAAVSHSAQAKLDPTNMSIAELIGAIKPAQLWTAVVAALGALGGAFALGAKLIG